MEQEHERAAGAWHSEWPTLTDLLAHRRLGGLLAGREPRRSLRVDTARMAATVGRVGRGAARPAPLAAALEPSLGTGAAHDAAADAVQQARESGRPLAEDPGRPRRTSTSTRCSAAAPDVGEAGAQVDAVLAEHRRLTEGAP